MIEARIQKRFLGGTDSSAFALDVKFRAADGITVLFGPSGAGKTLILECIAGFVQPQDGRILIGDRVVFDQQTGVTIKPQARRCGYVFQTYALFPHMTVRENLEFPLTRVQTAERGRRVSAMLKRFHLEDVSGRRPHEISGGQKQRCSIARALVGEPQILLLDEPARGLDAPLRMELYAIIRQVREEFRTPVLLVTHDLEECFELADEMLIISNGRIVQSGTPSAICEAPATLEVAQLLGIFTVVQMEIKSVDPHRKEVILAYGDSEIRSRYSSSRPMGEYVNVALVPGLIHARPRTSAVEGELTVQLVRTLSLPQSVRLEFSNGLQAEISQAEFERQKHNRDWILEVPPDAVKVI